MSRLNINKKQRLVATIAISGGFFIAELVIGYRTKSLALIADAFHYMNDLLGFAVALIAVIVSDRKTPPPRTLPFGWKRAQVLGAFFNGVFLLALGVSILLQAIERFTQLAHVEDPVLVLTMGCIGLGLNVIVMGFLHENHHNHKQECESGGLVDEESTRETSSPSNTPPPPADATTISKPPSTTTPDPKPATVVINQHHRDPHGGRDLGMLGVLIHVASDAINNVGVIVAALVIWKGTSQARFYADPGVGVFIALIIMASAWPLCRRAGQILMESAPPHIDVDVIRAEMMKVSGVQAVTDLLIWRLDQTTTLATAHITVTDDNSVITFASTAEAVSARLLYYGICSVALQPATAIMQRRQWSQQKPDIPQAAGHEGAFKGGGGVREVLDYVKIA
ncbi:cation diffusion facilitator family transporter [Colletotrichum orchidophilum]|uniref:Cation diffusion facilitator family transporter n=1 Tax=Colletotrichum orchidophilum TaxID=1209926 RepID=A0A1G4AUR9_9PEZI|nr:cation diffusion facilitator family transporter [Colletotrichum orchidophilum]OHE92855.1 cation diffusion facilitator family transporter [Colletotrichum orchidophilum]